MKDHPKEIIFYKKKMVNIGKLFMEDPECILFFLIVGHTMFICS